MSAPRKGRRAATSSSALVNPDTPIHALASAFQDYMHIPDPLFIYVVMGAMAGNMMTGVPPWLMIIGQSGQTKTKMIKSLLKLERVRQVASIKGEAALLSGTAKKDRAKDATGGLLRELGDNGCLAFTDLTSLMSKDPRTMGEMLGILRELFDRTWKRDIGAEGGRSLKHTGRVCVVAGVTHAAIDRQTEVNAEMGQRSLYYRLPWSSGYQEAMSAVQDVEPDESTIAMQDLVHSMFYGLEMSFANPRRRRVLTLTEADRIVELGRLAVKMRNVVPRDWRDRNVIDVPTDEMATRMSQQLAQLYVGMDAIGVEEEERWRGCEKIVMDSMPLIRRACLTTVMDGINNGGLKVSTASVARVVKVSETAARRTLEDLELLDVVTRITGVNGSGVVVSEGWKLSEWSRERLGKIYGGRNDRDN